MERRIESKSSRVGSRGYKSPPPLRFASVADARAHMKANKMKMVEHVSTPRGMRIQVVNGKGKARTISIERPKVEE